MFDNFNVNLRKNEGFPTCIPCIPIPEYSQSNAPLVTFEKMSLSDYASTLLKITFHLQYKHSGTFASHKYLQTYRTEPTFKYLNNSTNHFLTADLPIFKSPGSCLLIWIAWSNSLYLTKKVAWSHLEMEGLGLDL